MSEEIKVDEQQQQQPETDTTPTVEQGLQHTQAEDLPVLIDEKAGEVPQEKEVTAAIVENNDDAGSTIEIIDKGPKKKTNTVKPEKKTESKDIVFAMKFEGEDYEFGLYLDSVISNLIELGHFDTKQAALKMIVAFAINKHYVSNSLILPKNKEMVIYKPKQKKK